MPGLWAGSFSSPSNRIVITRTSKDVHMVRDTRDPSNPFAVRMTVHEELTTPKEIRQSFKEASAEISISVSLGAISALGLLVLHALGRRERSLRMRGHRKGRIPPWRVPRTVP